MGGSGGTDPRADRQRRRRRRRRPTEAAREEQLVEDEHEDEQEDEHEDEQEDRAPLQLELERENGEHVSDLCGYVDQNRNLDLSELLDKDDEREFVRDSADDEQPGRRKNEQSECSLDGGGDGDNEGLVGGRLDRQRANISPILSLSSGQSSNDCTTSTTSTTQRMSQTSLSTNTNNLLLANKTTNEAAEQENGRHHEQDSFEFPERAQFGSQLHVTIDMKDRPRAATIAAEHSDYLEQEKFARRVAQHCEFDAPMLHDPIKADPAADSLARQLGRRVSVLPQLVARRMSRQGSGARFNLRAEDSRRFSLPPPQRPEEELGSSGPLLSASPQGEVPLATVAGVGGTITTVTRSKRKTAPLPRLVAKNGQVNLFLDNIDRRQYVRDLFTTMIDIKWRYNLMAAAFGFVFSWLFFACVWYLVLYFHDDLEHEHDPNWSPCIVNVYSFSAALLFSIETQSTLGFGSRIISVECPGAIVIFCIQLIFGVVVECLIVGMVFAKLSRPTKRSQTIMYSKYATVCLRESRMCLTFRVGDVRSKSHIIGATIRASLVSSKTTPEGEIIPFYHYKLKVIIDDCKDSLLLIWPVTIVHVIDESSPFYALDADQLANFKFEIITVLEGTVESTGQSIQVRSSYLPSEVKWGYRFEPIVSTHGYGRYAQTIIDYNKFNRIVEVPTPSSSPRDYYAAKANSESEPNSETS